MLRPVNFCWTRYGTEAGESIESILKRKEEERSANGGVFLWGIGNAIAPSMRELIRLERDPQVLFSPMRSKPKPTDVNPSMVVAWAGACALDGGRFHIPPSSVVTSRMDASNPKISHFALVCYSDEKLVLRDDLDFLNLHSMRNLRTGRAIGASQTTAIVTHAEPDVMETNRYAVSLRVRLVSPFLLQLRDPVVVPEDIDYGSLAEYVRCDWATPIDRQLRLDLLAV